MIECYKSESSERSKYVRINSESATYILQEKNFRPHLFMGVQALKGIISKLTDKTYLKNKRSCYAGKCNINENARK
jgi:hypothetical protein